MKLGPNQRKWIEALRSGKYKQGTTYLKFPTGETTENSKFCCLGVACEVLNLISIKSISLTFESYTALGLRTAFGGNKNNSWSLANLNDKDNWNFNQIADELEKNPEEWFTESK